LFSREDRIEWELERQVSAVSAVKQALYQTVMVKRGLSIYQ